MAIDIIIRSAFTAFTGGQRFFFLLALLTRFATVLYFLNNVEDGGETAFPIADNRTFDDQVSHKRFCIP